MSDSSDRIDNSGDSEMMMSDGDTGAAVMAAARMHSGPPEDGTNGADGGEEPTGDNPSSAPIGDVLESDRIETGSAGRPGGTGGNG